MTGRTTDEIGSDLSILKSLGSRESNSCREYRQIL